jgi:hypothetical protein
MFYDSAFEPIISQKNKRRFDFSQSACEATSCSSSIRFSKIRSKEHLDSGRS